MMKKMGHEVSKSDRPTNTVSEEAGGATVGRALGAVIAIVSVVCMALVLGAEPLGAQQRPVVALAEHPNGTIVRIHKMTEEPRAMRLEISVLNRSSNRIALSAQGGAVLADARGNSYQALPLDGNPELGVPPGGRLDTALTFPGQLKPGVRKLTLSFNGGTSGAVDDANTAAPGIAMVLPLGSEHWTRVAADASAFPQAPAQASANAADVQQKAAQVDTLRNALGARPTEKGLVVTLEGDVLFEFDKAEVLPAAEPTLHKLAELIKKTRPSAVLVEGHTDSKGSKDYNVKLSLSRAVAVAVWLERIGGITGTKIDKVGYGEKMPVAWNSQPDGSDNPEGRHRNRRVEVILIEAGKQSG